MSAFIAGLGVRIDAHAAQTTMPAACVGIIRAGDFAFVHGCGETRIGNGETPTGDTVFRIASMTKSFTAAAILLLRDRGLVQLDESIDAYLPWTRSIGAPAGSPPITVRDLLTMNAGLPTDDPWGDRHEPTPIAQFDALVAGGLTFSRMPRTGFEYSNLGYALLGRIVTQVAGVDYLAFVARELLEPLEMRSTVFHTSAVEEARRAHGYVLRDGGLVAEPRTGPGAFSPMGGLHSTVNDLTKWVTGLQSAWHGDTAHPLGRASRREMQEGRTFRGAAVKVAADASEPQLRAPLTTTKPNLPAVETKPGAPGVEPKSIASLYGYGLAISIDSALGTFVHHSGGYPGFGSHMRWHPASGWGIVMLANRSYAPVYEFAADLLAEIVAAYPASEDVAATLLPATLDAMDIAERLVAEWDDRLADEHFAFNVDLDVPRDERRSAVRRVCAEIGSFSREPHGWSSTSPAQVTWRVRGAAGNAELEVLMTPERLPKIQMLRIDHAREAPR